MDHRRPHHHPKVCPGCLGLGAGPTSPSGEAELGRSAEVLRLFWLTGNIDCGSVAHLGIVLERLHFGSLFEGGDAPIRSWF